jgi:hypothetical protein
MIGPMVASPPTAPPDATGSIAPGAR